MVYAASNAGGSLDLTRPDSGWEVREWKIHCATPHQAGVSRAEFRVSQSFAVYGNRDRGRISTEYQPDDRQSCRSPIPPADVAWRVA